jgi:Mrp family chromosome partitioning ATPase
MQNQLRGPRATNVEKQQHLTVHVERKTRNKNLQTESPAEADFPVGVLPEKLAHMVTAMSACYQVPPSLPAGALLATVAASIGRGLKVESGPDRTTNPNLFVLASAGSGVGKSTTINDAVAPIRRMQAALRSSELMPQFEVPEECEPTLTVDDITGAALPAVMAANGQKIFAVSAEAGDHLKDTSMRGSKLKSVLLKGFSNEPIEVHRISRTHVSMDRPSIAVLWMCQPHRLDEFLAQPHLLESGLLARFLVMHSGGSMPSLTGKEPKVPQMVKAAYEGVVEELFMQYFQNDVRSQKVRSPEKAQALMREFHNHVEARANTDRQDITACICRWPEQAWRLALVLHAATYGKDSHKHPLAVATAANAIKLTRWFGDQQIKILNATGSQRQTQRMRKLLRNLQNSLDGELTFRDLRNSHGFSSEEVEELVAAFPDRFRIEVVQNPNGGPKSHLLCLP